jgi:hypothetical protein
MANREIGGSRAESGNDWEEDQMIGVVVTFDYDDGEFDQSRVEKVAESARGMFEGMPGLTTKLFTFDEKQGRALNLYVGESRAAAEQFFSPELRERVTGLYGVTPSIEFRRASRSWTTPRHSDYPPRWAMAASTEKQAVSDGIRLACPKHPDRVRTGSH